MSSTAHTPHPDAEIIDLLDDVPPDAVHLAIPDQLPEQWLRLQALKLAIQRDYAHQNLPELLAAAEKLRGWIETGQRPARW
jgi:hypothetical protein